MPRTRLTSGLADQIRNSLAFLALVISTSLPVSSAPAATIDHLDRIILLMAVNLSGTPAPLASPDRSTLVLYGAVSAEAAVAAMQNFIKPLGEEQAKNIRFAPASYRYLLNATTNDKQNKGAIKALILPDPSQIEPATRLYEQQSIASAKALELAKTQPTVFCPEPALYAQIKEGTNSGKRFIPCSFDFTTLSDLIKSSPKTKIVAIPWVSFTSLLTQGKQDYLKDIEVLLSPSTQKAIQQTRTDRQFLKRD